jgi:hypothetical protein
MIIHNLDAFGVAFRPDKADTPLIVDSNTVLAGSATNQGLQSVPGRSRQITKQCRLIQLTQFALSAPLYIVRQLSGEPSMKQRFGISVRKGQYHWCSGKRNAF